MSNFTGALPPPDGVTANLDNPEDVLYTINLVSQILFVAIVTPLVAFRAYSKAVMAPPFILEDCE